MKIAMSGASGFVGTRLSEAFREAGYEVIPIARDDFMRGVERVRGLISGAEVVVNLAGAPIIARWSERYKRELYSSRIDTTRMMVQCMEGIKQQERPSTFISTSAVGIYANGDKAHTESDYEYAGDGFLGMLARDWEKEADRAGGLGIRTVILRFGIVLSPEGGALAKMLVPFRLGLGGRVGSGKQYVSWMHMDDLIGVFRHVIDSSMRGVYNLTSPGPVTNAEFTQALGRVLRRPAILWVPEFALKAQFGEGAQVLTEGQRVLPQRLLQEGYEFLHEEIFESLQSTFNQE